LLNTTTRPISSNSKPLGLIWINHSHSIVAIGLERALEAEAWVHVGREPPKDVPSSVIYCTDDAEALPESLEHIQRFSPNALILVCGLRVDLALAWAALRLGARGFVHSQMEPEQVVRAVRVATEGELVAPRKLLEHLITHDNSVDFDALSARQQEILGFVTEGLSNAEIARCLYLSESTVKQHLRAAYKLLGVHNRTEAAKLIRNGH